jgi:hypothetical protein
MIETLKSVLLIITSVFLIHTMINKNKLNSEIQLLKSQLETIEPELPVGVTEPLSPETVMAIDMFCVSWREIKGE